MELSHNSAQITSAISFFTNLLLPKIILAGHGARIVVVSSSAHRYATGAFDDYNFHNGETYSEWDGYTKSKAVNCLFARALAVMLAKRGIQAFSLHPGSIDSGMQSQVSKEAMAQAAKRAVEAAAEHGGEHKRAERKSVKQGCATTLVAALDPSIAPASGAYLDDAQISQAAPSALVENMANADALWYLSEEIVGQKFNWT